MHSSMNFIKTTLVGGIVFLVPIVILAMILGKAYALMLRVAAPLSDLIPLEAIGGVTLANLLAVLVMLASCFLAGLVAKSRLAARAIGSLENSVLSAIPGYAFVKGMIGGIVGAESEGKLDPVLVRLDDAWQVAFEVERCQDGRVVVYVPGAPEPWSGAVLLVDAERVERLDIKMPSAIKNIKGLGRGTGALLKATGEKGRRAND